MDMLPFMNMPAQQIRLLVLDIDGTLLNPQRELTERTRTALHMAQQAGIAIALATGRRYNITASIASDLALKAGLSLILYDGAIVLNYPANTILHTNFLPAAHAQQALELLVEHRLQPVIHHLRDDVEEIWTGPAEFDTVWVEEQFRRFASGVRRFPYADCCSGQPDPLRVLAYGSEEHIQRILPAAMALPCSWNITRSHLRGGAVLSLLNRVCSKASGVTALAQSLDIPLEQVMAIGDDDNDISMMQVVGWSVAMGQATAQVKATARAITTTNTEDGAARAIESYVLRSR
jgi:Cof subfamily protein (haloacid dehalogenase superfamily)